MRTWKYVHTEKHRKTIGLHHANAITNKVFKWTITVTNMIRAEDWWYTGIHWGIARPGFNSCSESIKPKVYVHSESTRERGSKEILQSLSDCPFAIHVSSAFSQAHLADWNFGNSVFKSPLLIDRCGVPGDQMMGIPIRTWYDMISKMIWHDVWNLLITYDTHRWPWRWWHRCPPESLRRDIACAVANCEASLEHCGPIVICVFTHA